jgi:predicted nuclease of restriction endonuclease-like (RecB) superfamily
LNIPDTHYFNLFNRISYTHFVELIRVDDSLKRLFYESECLKGTWSVKELKRQIGSLLYERTGLSQNKERLLAMVQATPNANTFTDLIRDPYIFEFLGLKQQEVLPEKELEQALLDHLLQFLLELGKGFCFEARQKRIVIDNEHHFIDMVFYHRLLHCNILVELKTERFNHTHAGQLNMYLEYYKKYETVQGDNPPVGILLCTDKDQEHVEFATAGLDDKVFVAKYLVALPDKNELEQFIKKELKDNRQ